MVSFSCEVCNDTVVKKKLDQHQQRCYGAYFTCIDCSVTFQNNDHRKHTSCISEAEKYEKALYKGPKKKQQQQQPKQAQISAPVAPAPAPTPAKEEKPKKEKKEKKSKKSSISTYLKTGKQENLYKIIKKMSEDNSQDKKEVLKKLSLVLGEDGTVTVELN